MNVVNYIVGKEFAPAVIKEIESAQHKIDIVVFDWRWYADLPNNAVSLFNQAIQRAQNRGVYVRAIVNSANIKERLVALGIDARTIHSKNLVHAKIILIDDTTVIMGSHNYTSQAFNVNMEASVIIKQQEKPERLQEFFDTLWVL